MGEEETPSQGSRPVRSSGSEKATIRQWLERHLATATKTRAYETGVTPGVQGAEWTRITSESNPEWNAVNTRRSAPSPVPSPPSSPLPERTNPGAGVIPGEGGTEMGALPKVTCARCGDACSWTNLIYGNAPYSVLRHYCSRVCAEADDRR